MHVVKGLWRLLVAVKDGLVLLLLLLFFGLLYAALSARPNPRLPTSGALLLRLDGSIVEQPQDADPIALLSGNGPATREYRLRDVVRAIDAARSDPAITAIVLDLDRFTGGGQAAMVSVGEALDRARRAGKPVLAYATGYADDSYQLAVHASEVWLNPLGAVLIQGPGGARLYYKGLLDKLGVTANVYRVGTYKSAVEPFIRTDQSPEARAANQALADSLLASWMDDVGKTRPKAQLKPYVSDPAAALATARGDSAAAARNAGLVDTLGDRATFEQRVAKLAGPASDGTYSAVFLEDYLAARAEPAAGGVGVLTIAGDIVDGTAGPGTAAGDTIAGLLTEELARNRIKALVVRIDSPGGSVTGAERIRSCILKAKAKGLPIVVSMGNVAASGGYWVSTPASTIFAEPSTVTGSIGVFGMLPTFAGTLQKLGLSADGVGTTPLSGQPDVYRGTSPVFDRLIQTGIENIYGRFVGLVAQSRHLPAARVNEIGQGRVWAGGTARQIGLVDRFGGVEEAIAFAADAAKLTGAARNPRWIEREPNSWKALLRDWTQKRDRGDAAADVWTRVAHTPQTLLLRALDDAEALADGPAIQVRCLECAASEPGRTPRAGSMARLLAAKLGL
ncbi:signal peptide peptidase SppA [uncultured Sphingomonas sp.]|uniref:signal peptide peptidase SppA n=1 Tax=uncultured Sphingomonas sp. TaxID=158754 RepID=UPI0025D3C409|nr:signal peptide peptidase SppA [uncultured Sphingomonas sp.]